MKRRDVLSGIAGLSVLALAGCSGADDDDESDLQAPNPGDGGGGDGGDGNVFTTTTTTPDPVPNLELEDFDFREGSSGNLEVTAKVQNVGDEQGRGMLIANVETGGERYEMTKEVTVDVGDTTEYVYQFDVAYDTFFENGSLTFDWKSA